VDVRGVVGGECHGMIGKEVYLGHVVSLLMRRDWRRVPK
jgi:hypothetical protein